MTLQEFYRHVDGEFNKAQEKVNQYVTLAKSSGVPEEDYEKDSVYIALSLEASKYRFAKTLVMDKLQATGGSSFFKRK